MEGIDGNGWGGLDWDFRPAPSRERALCRPAAGGAGRSEEVGGQGWGCCGRSQSAREFGERGVLMQGGRLQWESTAWVHCAFMMLVASQRWNSILLELHKYKTFESAPRPVVHPG